MEISRLLVSVVCSVCLYASRVACYNLLFISCNVFRSSIDDVFYFKILIEKRRVFNLDTHFACIDYEEAFARVNISIVWDVMC